MTRFATTSPAPRKAHTCPATPERPCRETVQVKPAFRDSFTSRRCLIPATGFHECKKSGRIKQPLHFGMRDGSLFAFAGLWDTWTSPTGAKVESRTILTTTAHSLLEDVHERMPVILPHDGYEQWLVPAKAKTHAELLVPFDGALMMRYEVSTLVNAPKNDGPDCIIPIDHLPASSFRGALIATRAT